MKMISRAFLATMLALAGIGCGDDDGDGDDVDMFTPPVDMYTPPEEDMGPGEDMGPEETDMFVPSIVNVRVAHLIPDAPNVRLCIGPEGLRSPAPALPSATDVPDGIPFRAVGGYIQLPIDGVDTYEARVFAASTIDDGVGNCSLTDDPLLTINVTTADLTADAYYTVAAIGLVTPGDVQCPDPDGDPGDTIACPAAVGARIEIYEDSDVDADNALIRVLHAIPNAPPVDICYDADGSGGATEDPVELFENVAFGEASDYNMQDADLTGGTFRIFAHLAPGMDCPTGMGGAFELFELEIPTNTSIQAAFGADGAGLNIVTDSYDTGSVHTIFAEGIAGVAPPDAGDPDNGFTAFVPIIDLPAAP